MRHNHADARLECVMPFHSVRLRVITPRRHHAPLVSSLPPPAPRRRSAGSPEEATGQLRVSLHWSGVQSGGPHVYAEFGSRGAHVVGSFGQPSRRYRTARPRQSVYLGRGTRIPPGHVPGPGQCRVWHPNRPPGHRPPPFRCADRYDEPYRPGYGYDDPRRFGPVQSKPRYLEDPRHGGPRRADLIGGAVVSGWR
jgi:hypothetical protein